LIEGAKVPVLEAIAWVAFVGHHLLREGQQLQASPALRAVLEQLLVVVVVPVLVATLVVAIPQPNGRIGIPDLDVKALLLSPQPQVSFPAQLPELRFLRDLYIVGTRVHAHLVVLLSAHGVQAKVLIPHILDGTKSICRRIYRRIGLHQIEGHLLHEPLEGLALQLGADRLLRGQISRVHTFVKSIAVVVQVVLVLVHPNLCHAFVVLQNNQGFII